MRLGPLSSEWSTSIISSGVSLALIAHSPFLAAVTTLISANHTVYCMFSRCICGFILYLCVLKELAVFVLKTTEKLLCDGHFLASCLHEFLSSDWVLTFLGHLLPPVWKGEAWFPVPALPPWIA